ncbi:MAG: hypothetical protein WD739_00555 [Actinomycetota bacterium]
MRAGRLAGAAVLVLLLSGCSDGDVTHYACSQGKLEAAMTQFMESGSAEVDGQFGDRVAEYAKAVYRNDRPGRALELINDFAKTCESWYESD